MSTKRVLLEKGFTISQEESKNGWTMPYEHYHSSYEIYILVYGERIITIDGIEYETRSYDAALIMSGAAHKSRGDVPFSGICIHFNSKYIDSYFSDFARRRLMECFKKTIICLTEESFLRIKAIADDFNADNESNFVYLADILNILGENCNSSPDAVHTADDHISKADSILSYVNENYASIQSIGDIAGLFSVSEGYVFKIFKRRYSMTPKSYINKLRIKFACYRLKYQERKVHEIAASCGFESYEYFVRVFKQEMGCTPSAYRQKINTKEMSLQQH